MTQDMAKTLLKERQIADDMAEQANRYRNETGALEALLEKAIGALRRAERKMELGRERMHHFARAEIGVVHGACPKYGEQELRLALGDLRTTLAEIAKGRGEP